MAAVPRSRKKAGDQPAEAPEAVALPAPAVEEEERKKVVLPGPVRLRWDTLAEEATRKRCRVEVRIKEGTSPEETDEGDLVGAFLLFATGRGGVSAKLGETATFGAAIETLARWVEKQPGLGADELREELKTHGRRLALLGTRDVARKAGSLPPIYLDFRDRILPLAWDNLVEAVKVERLAAFVQKVAEVDVAALPPSADPWSDLVEEARSLVAPMFEEKEDPDAATAG